MNNTEIIPVSESELVPTSGAEAITRGEIDIQISTAHKYPRSMSVFKQRALDMATIDEETAASCIYSRPVGKDPETGKMKYAEGLSVRAAEIVGASYGNLRVGAVITEQTPRYVKARGFAHDLETNFASATEVIEATVKRNGVPYDERMRIVIAKSALAKARRDATFQVVPKALFRSIEVACRKVAVGDGTTLARRRQAVLEWIGKLGVDKSRVFSALGVKGEDDLGAEQLADLTGIRTAIKDGEITVDEAFPEIAGEESKPKRGARKVAGAAPDFSKDKEEPEDKPKGPPPPVATNDHDKVRIALADMSIKQQDFVAGLRSVFPQVPGTAQIVADLSDDFIKEILETGLDGIIAMIEKKIGKALA